MLEYRREERTLNFIIEPPPARGVASSVLPGIRHIVADNPGPMTYHGTNTYLIDWDGGVAVLDPGPDDPAHVRHILDLAGGPIRAILLTHGHHDHRGAVPALRAATGATFYAWATLEPDIAVADGGSVGPWRAVHTPGHAPDHLCFAGRDGVVFSGDHVMGWSSTVVGGPGGDMAAYMRSLERLLEIDASHYLPGHGPVLTEPRRFAEALLKHRRAREREILASLGAAPASASSLVATLYRGLDPSLARAAEANVIAHLQKLAAEGRAVSIEAGWALP